MTTHQVQRTPLFAQAGPAFHLLAACCMWPPDERRSTRLRQVIAQRPDWDEVLALAKRHRIAGQASAALANQPDIPAQVHAVLDRQAARIARQNLLSLGRASAITRAFESSQIPFLILKGAPLCMLAYGDLKIRHSRDIDLLVDVADLLTACAALQGLGFHRTSVGQSLTQRQSELWTRFRKHFEFVHPETGVRLELHWRAFDNRQFGEPANILQTREWVRVSAGVCLPALPKDELLLHLCQHGASHAWFRLKWIADLEALFAADPEARQRLFTLAEQRGLLRPVEQALTLCNELFHAGERSRYTSRTSLWLARIGRNALLQDTAAASTETDFVPRGLTTSRFFLRRDLPYKFEELRVNTAAPIDWQTLPLPSWLQFAYPALRLPLWIKRRWFSPVLTRNS